MNTLYYDTNKSSDSNTLGNVYIRKIDHAMLYTSYKKTVGTLSVAFPFTPHPLPPIPTPTPTRTLLPLGFDVQPFFVLSPLSC